MSAWFFLVFLQKGYPPPMWGGRARPSPFVHTLPLPPFLYGFPSSLDRSSPTHERGLKRRKVGTPPLPLYGRRNVGGKKVRKGGGIVDGLIVFAADRPTDRKALKDRRKEISKNRT